MKYYARHLWQLKTNGLWTFLVLEHQFHDYLIFMTSLKPSKGPHFQHYHTGGSGYELQELGWRGDTKADPVTFGRP